jgi:exodeoxyribonuclease VII large subunit
MPQPEALGLYELNRQIRLIVQSGFPESVWVIAEISDMSVNRSGHCYLELIEKEPEGDKILARTRATIWATNYRRLRPYFESTTGQALDTGIKILVKADVEFHEVYSISLNIRDIEPSFTIGELERKRRMIIRKLEDAGVIDMNRDLDLPPVPQRIAVISSPTAAGYGDFTDQLSQNGRGYHFYTHLFPAVMQGAETGPSIISALEAVHRYSGFFDVAVIIRGGGSKLDLSSFDDFELGFNVAQFPLPVISGIGHEQDDTIVDLVAHTRCKTPTAAAEFLIGLVSDFEDRLDDGAWRMTDHVNGILESEHHRIGRMAEGIRLRVTAYAGFRKLSLEQVPVRLKSLMLNFTRYKRIFLDQVPEKAGSLSRPYLRLWNERLANLNEKARLQDPVNILKMGYSITMKNGRPVKSFSDLAPGDELTTRLAEGLADSVVTRSIPVREGLNALPPTDLSTEGPQRPPGNHHSKQETPNP